MGMDLFLSTRFSMIDRRRFGMLVGAMAAGGVGAQTAQAQPSLLRSLKYEELGRLVRAQTGKVVLVDMWRHD